MAARRLKKTMHGVHFNSVYSPGDNFCAFESLNLSLKILEYCLYSGQKI